MENSMEVPQKSKTVITVWLSYPSPEHIYTEKAIIQKDTHPCVHCSTIHNSQDVGATWMSINGGMDKEDAVDRHGYLLSSFPLWKTTQP